MSEDRVTPVPYNPPPETVKARTFVYEEIDEMIEARNQSYRQFNHSDGDRTATKYWDDSDRRLNGYTHTREEQGKEDWQENVFNPVTRNKLKAVVAGVALTIPEMEYKAVNKDGLFSSKRAELAKQLVRHSRITHGNPQLDIFFEAWECAARGTVIKYDGYLKTKYKRKIIKSVDISTGEIEFDEKEVTVDDRPIDINVPLSELFIKNFRIFDIQDQPALAWVQHYTLEQVEQEFGHYPNFKFVKDGQSIKQFKSTTDTYYYEAWGGRTTLEKDDFEVIRYYNKFKDMYEIWINGVDILRAPLLWGKEEKKYPFSKTIFEPFEGKQFFYGKSLPGTLEGNQDIDNTLWNSILDKMYRSLEKPLLVGLVNKDLLDVEDELVNQDNKIYVPDVSQVKPIPFEGVSNSDVTMLQVVARAMDLTSLDQNQQGQQGRGVTAREILIADENAKKLKGLFFMFLEDLWLQKTRLRILNILMNYMRPKVEKVIGKDGKETLQEALSIYNIPDVELADGTTGTLGIQVGASKTDRARLAKKGVAAKPLLTEEQIGAREMAINEQGINYKLVAVSSDYLDDYIFDFVVIPSTLFTKDQVKLEAMVSEKIERLATFFPEVFAANKDKVLADLLELYGETPEEYPNKPPPPPEPGERPEGNMSPLEEGAALGQK